MGYLCRGKSEFTFSRSAMQPRTPILRSLSPPGTGWRALAAWVAASFRRRLHTQKTRTPFMYIKHETAGWSRSQGTQLQYWRCQCDGFWS